MAINSLSFLVGHLGPPTMGLTFKSRCYLILTTSKFCSLIALFKSWNLCILEAVKIACVVINLILASISLSVKIAFCLLNSFLNIS